MTAIFMIGNIFDRLFIDEFWVGHTKAWLIPRTEDLMPYIPVKVKIKKWLDIPDIRSYENFICRWHYFLKDTNRILQEMGQEKLANKINRYILEQFYRKPYDGSRDFYEQFQLRLQLAKRYVGISG